MRSVAITVEGGEGDIAKPLKDIQDRYPAVIIGSYPFEGSRGFAATLVLRSRDDAALVEAERAVKAMAEELTASGKARGWLQAPAIGTR